MNTLAVVEDNAKIQANILAALKEEGYDAKAFRSAEAFLSSLDRKTLLPDLLLLDIRLEGMSGIELIQALTPDRLPPTIVISGEATITEAMQALRLGIHDFIEKPFSDERLLLSVKNCLETHALKTQLRALEHQLRTEHGILGASEPIQTLLETLKKIAPTQGRVLITGESGTGKELVANTLHAWSARREHPLVKINCASIPAHLVEDELFGHVRGAFTDAHQSKPGLFEEAHKGTLFLDEIGDMDMALQARLLRVLEDGVIRRIGDVKDRHVDVRVVAATNKDLAQRVRQGLFREDLFYRLSSLPVHVPPLRERITDIPLLFTHFVQDFCKENHLRPKKLDPDVLTQLKRYNWPGNVRELKNLCERIVVFAGDTITLDDLPAHLFQHRNEEPQTFLRRNALRAMPLKTLKHQCELEFIEAMLRRHGWNYAEVARLLDINRSYLHQKVTALGIERPDKRRTGETS